MLQSHAVHCLILITLRILRYYIYNDVNDDLLHCLLHAASLHVCTSAIEFYHQFPRVAYDVCTLTFTPGTIDNIIGWTTFILIRTSDRVTRS